MIRKLNAGLILLCLATFSARAEAVQDEYVRLEWPSLVCATPALPATPKTPIPITSKRYSKLSLLAPLRKDISRFLKARARAYGAFADVMSLTRGHCPHKEFIRSIEAHSNAMESRKNHDLNKIPKEEIEWVSEAEYRRRNPDKNAPAPGDPFGLAQVCRRPESPPKLKIPVVPEAAPAEIRKVLKDLIRDTKKFYTAQLEQYFVQLELMSLDQAFHCREVTLSFRGSRQSQYNAFYQRRSDDLAKIADKTTAWELQK